MIPSHSKPAHSGTQAEFDRPTAALVAADRWTLWRTLSRGLAHHLANAAQMLAIDPPPARARAEAAERVGLAQVRLVDVHRENVFGPTLVPEVLEDVQAIQRLQAGFPSMELALDLATDLPPVGMSAADLRHALLSLVTNAKHAAAGERATIRVSAHAVEDGVEIAVENDGPGLPPDVHERAFEPYFTTRESDALGLGLTVARALVRRAGGTLGADPGTSRFRLCLPAWRRAR